MSAIKGSRFLMAALPLPARASRIPPRIQTYTRADSLVMVLGSSATLPSWNSYLPHFLLLCGKQLNFFFSFSVFLKS